jgi:para-nitrobenzyl esterase
MTLSKLALLCMALAPLALASTARADTPPRVEVEGGAVVGTHADELAVFRGIPFAAPPVRELRWKAPQPVEPWQGDLVADRFSPMCLQALRAKNSVFYLGEESSSEDCLYLNVWSGAKAGGKEPVMVFIYGGGWTIGSASLPLYDGAPLAHKGVVTVSFNYRVGALGFMAHPELTAEGKGSSGNYGLMDMIAALKWVKANIARFGGDPGNVTLYGQSAGSVAIALLAASPQATGLFHRAIGESGGYALGGRLATLAEGEKAGVAAAAKLKATSLQALRNLGGDAIVAGDNTMRPVIDGVVLPQQPIDVYAAGKQMKVPVLIGSNADEGTAYPVVMTPAAFEADARKRYGADADALLKLYPAKTEDEARASSYALMRDRTFAAPMRLWGVEQSKVAPVFMCHFSRVHPFVDGVAFQQQDPGSKMGAYHGSEMAYAYGTYDVLNKFGTTRAWNDGDIRYSDAMMLYWLSFAHSGDPNVENQPTWPAYKPDSEQVMLFGADIKPGVLPNRPQLDFFAHHPN